MSFEGAIFTAQQELEILIGSSAYHEAGPVRRGREMLLQAYERRDRPKEADRYLLYAGALFEAATERPGANEYMLPAEAVADALMWRGISQALWGEYDEGGETSEYAARGFARLLDDGREPVAGMMSGWLRKFGRCLEEAAEAYLLQQDRDSATRLFGMAERAFRDAGDSRREASAQRRSAHPDEPRLMSGFLLRQPPGLDQATTVLGSSTALEFLTALAPYRRSTGRE